MSPDGIDEWTSMERRPGRLYCALEDGKINPYLLPKMASKKGSGAGARWLTKAVRQFLPESVPKEERHLVCITGARSAGITEMGLGGVDFYSSHARSGHVIPSNQQKYLDRDHYHLSLKAAKCLAGWTDFNASVSLPNLECLGISEDIINNLIDNYSTISS